MMALAGWRGVLVAPALASRLALLPEEIHPTGSRSGLRTWVDFVALRAAGRPASRTSWHFSGYACDVSPSARLTPKMLLDADLCAPVRGEPWHLEALTRSANPWRIWGSGARVPGWRLAIADLGPERWAAWVDPGASEEERAYPYGALAQAYLALAARMSSEDVDGLVGRRTLLALGLPSVGAWESRRAEMLPDLRRQAERRGVFAGEALR